VLFFDSDKLKTQIAEKLVNKIMDIFIYKYEKKLRAGVKYGKYDSFQSALSLIYLDTIKDMLKSIFIDLSI